MSQLVLLVCLLLVSLGNCSPFSEEKCNEVQTAQHQFDLGSLMSCVVPSGSDLQGDCPNVDYPIPTVTVQDQASHVSLIQSVVKSVSVIASIPVGFDPAPCVQDFSEELCSFFFPRCSDDHSTVDVSFNCTRAMKQCPSEYADNFRNLCPQVSGNEGAYPIEPCKQKPEPVPLGNCALEADRTLPSWLAVLTKAIEGYAMDAYNALAEGSCADMWRNYTCRRVGRCWAQGCRLERTNSKEDCTAVDTCMEENLSPNQYDVFSRSLACETLPLESVRPITSATPITDPTTQPSTEPTTMMSPSTSSPFEITLPTSAGLPSLHGITILVILSAVLLSCLLAL